MNQGEEHQALQLRPEPPGGSKHGPHSDDPFRLLVESAKDYAIFLLDADGVVVSWNAGAERMKGYTADEIIGQSFTRFYLPKDIAAGRPAANLREALKNGQSHDDGWRVRKDGTRFFASVSITALWDTNGALRGFGKVTRDTTAAREAEQALRDSEERFRLLVDRVVDYAIFVLDVDGHVLTWNEGARRLKGYEPHEIQGRHFGVFYLPDDREAGRPEMLLRRARDVGSSHDEGWRLRKDGTRFWADVTITALRDQRGRLRGYAKITRDLSERRDAEERIRAANADLERRVAERTAALEALNAELEAFSYSVSHDLRAPLRTMDGFSKVLETRLTDRLDQESRHYLERIRAGAQTMSHLIDALLRLSRVARAPVHRGPVDLGAMARQITEDLRRAAPARQVQVEIGADLRVSADPALARSLLQNLLANAWKFTAPRADARVEVGRRADGVFFVRDNGVGFDMTMADRLFAPFARLHQRSQFEGSGIGLATAARIVARHGGRIWAQAAPDQGATFFFRLEDA